MPLSNLASLKLSRAVLVLALGLGLNAASGCKSTNGINGSSGLPLLTGSGAVTVTPTGAANSGAYTVDFGNVAVGQDQSAPVLLSNSGTSPLQILSVGAPSDPEFSVSLLAGTAVEPGAVLNVPVDFKPFSKGAKTATLVIADGFVDDSDADADA